MTYKLEDLIGKITCADCLDVLRDLPDKCVDLVLTDPPYGLNIDGQKQSTNINPKHNRKYHEKRGWDNSIPPPSGFCRNSKGQQKSNYLGCKLF